MFPSNYISVQQDQLEELINALQMDAPQPSIFRGGSRHLDPIIDQGWCEEWRFEDLLPKIDRRIGRTHFVRQEFLINQLDVELRFAFRQAYDPDEGAVGHMMFSSQTVACILIWFERLGFNVDPTHICLKIKDQIRADQMVDEQQITLLAYPAQRHAMVPVTIGSEDRRFPGGETSEFFTGSGYRAVIRSDKQDKPVSLEVHSPNYVEPRPQIYIKCAECHMGYVSGIRSDEHSHNIFHRKIVTTLRPTPSRALRRALQRDPEAVWVTPDSPSWMSVAVGRRARAFKREMKYDAIQWDAGDEPDATGFLFCDDSFRIVGACCFRPESSAEPDVSRLDWIWLCPDSRRNGFLTKNWDRFTERFGEFLIEPPISEAMKSFLRSRGNEHLIR